MLFLDVIKKPHSSLMLTHFFPASFLELKGCYVFQEGVAFRSWHNNTASLIVHLLMVCFSKGPYQAPRLPGNNLALRCTDPYR